ncbi:MAG: hypothetical protein R6X05_10465 [Desulfobacterales bacterium]
MKSFIGFSCALVLMAALCPAGGLAQGQADINARVDDLVGKHYMDGIPYEVARALGPEALPHLFELLGDSDRKPFWVNIIVTIGFIEDPSAVDPLVAFLENTEGEVDPFTFRALLSVPYALGCIAGGGSSRALQYLAGSVRAPLKMRWRFRGKPVEELITEQSVMGLAVSGQPEARSLLLELKGETKQKIGPEARALAGNNVDQALAIMDRIANRGRAAVLNPHYGD